MITQDELNAACEKNKQLLEDNKLLYEENEKLRKKIKELEDRIYKLSNYWHDPIGMKAKP